MENTFAKVRAHLQAARNRREWTQEQLAEMADVELEKVKNLESRRSAILIPGDQRSPTDWADFSAICQALGEDPVAVLRLNGVM